MGGKQSNDMHQIARIWKIDERKYARPTARELYQRTKLRCESQGVGVYGWRGVLTVLCALCVNRGSQDAGTRFLSVQMYPMS